MSNSDSAWSSDNLLATFWEDYERLYSQLFWREMLGLDENDQPRNKGPKGLKGLSAMVGIFDEVPEFSFWSHWPRVFTPKEFDVMWTSYTKDQKINYVLSLII